MSQYELTPGDVEDIRVLLSLKGPMHQRDIVHYLGKKAQRALTSYELGSRLGVAKQGHDHVFQRTAPGVWETANPP